MHDQFEIELEIGWFATRADIARMHEYGSSNLPSREHLNKVADSPEFQQYINTDYMNREFSKGIEVGMKSFGKLFIDFYKDFVASGKVKPKLKDSTIATKKAKGSKSPETPLIDTGLMLESIEARVNS
ncbi:hypothetical protein [Borrelia hispanica]|uniref:hypothetical protein n=1 Tax=Borrelia hispanica TaxID=40835 RepID=UPI0004646151|nr:hypothetical protein [Borrelia hispanica]